MLGLILFLLQATPNNANVMVPNDPPPTHDWAVIVFWIFIALVVGGIAWGFIHSRKTSTKGVYKS